MGAHAQPRVHTLRLALRFGPGRGCRRWWGRGGRRRSWQACLSFRGVAIRVPLPGSAILVGGVGPFGLRLGALRGPFGPCPAWVGRWVYRLEVPSGLGWGPAGPGSPGSPAAPLGP